jgi:twitching motility protein PilT
VDADHVNKLLSAGVNYGASDIHFKVGSPPSYRVDGTLRSLKVDKLTPANTEDVVRILCAKMVPQPDYESIRELDSSYSLPGTARFRVNIYRQRGTLSIILRIIPKDVPTLESLGLPLHLSKMADHERGLVLVTGATGSGKSSTLAALINRVNQTRPVHILTIEDPIEFLHSNTKASVSQREIGIDTANFNVALRSALRQDPDVILVGEMRDRETVDIALKAAETGHMVYSTVHTTDAAKTVNRLIAMFPPDEQSTVRMRLAELLMGTISQRLLPRADGKGRALACEIMVSTETTKEYMRDASRTAGLKGVLEKGRNTYGMQTFDQHLIQLLQAGTITKSTAMSAASSPADFERAMNFE